MTKLSDLDDERLRDLQLQCAETIAAVCDRLEVDSGVQSGVRRLMQATDMLGELNAIGAGNQELAGLILQGAIAVMVNSQSLRTIDAEWLRRRGERN